MMVFQDEQSDSPNFGLVPIDNAAPNPDGIPTFNNVSDLDVAAIAAVNAFISQMPNGKEYRNNYDNTIRLGVTQGLKSASDYLASRTSRGDDLSNKIKNTFTFLNRGDSFYDSLLGCMPCLGRAVVPTKPHIEMKRLLSDTD